MSWSRSSGRALHSPSRVRILRSLQTSGRPLGVAEVARSADVHVNTAREHLERLRSHGLVEREVEGRATRGRPRMLYRVAPVVGAATGDHRARQALARLLLGGYVRRWPNEHPPSVWRALAEVEALVLDLGLEPEVDAERLSVRLACPVRAGAPSSRAVAREVLTDLVRTALPDAAVVRVIDLEPVASSRCCVLHLAAVARPD